MNRSMRMARVISSTCISHTMLNTPPLALHPYSDPSSLLLLVGMGHGAGGSTFPSRLRPPTACMPRLRVGRGRGPGAGVGARGWRSGL
jgi:hypothetical protein